MSQNEEIEENLANIPEITKQLSEELQNIEKDMEDMDKIKISSIEEIEHKKKVLKKISSISVVCKEKEETLEELEKTNIDITARKLSITLLDQSVAELDEQIAKIQAEHDKTAHELEMKKRKLEELLEYYEELNARISELNDMMIEAEKNFNNKIEKLLRDKSELLKRTDLTDSQMNVLLNELEQQIGAIKKERNEALYCIDRQISEEFQIDVQKYKAIRLQKDLEKYLAEGDEEGNLEEEKSYKHELSSWEKSELSRKGFQLTSTGQLMVGDTTLSLWQAVRFGLYQPLDIIEGAEYGESPPWSAAILHTDLSYGKTSSRSSTTLPESLDSELSSEDIEYLKRNFGKPLTLALAEITAVQPSDPIHYLGHWLFKYRYNQELTEVQRKEYQELMVERDRIEAAETHKIIVEEAERAVWEALMRAENIAYEHELAQIAAHLEMAGEDEYFPDEEVPM